MSKPCACSWMRNETGDENRVKRSRWVLYERMTGHNRPPKTTTSCWRTIPAAGGFNECRNDSRATGNDSAVRQRPKARDGGWPVSVDGRRSRQAEARASELSGSAARSGGGRSLSARGSTTDSGGAFPQSENPGGLCLLRCAASTCGADPELGRRRLLESKRASYFSWRNWNG